MEEEKQYTPEEIANLEKSRAISDGELLKGGAEYKIVDGEKVLQATPNQLAEIMTPQVKLEYFNKYGDYDFIHKFGNMIYEAVEKDDTYVSEEAKWKVLGLIHDTFKEEGEIIDSIKKYKAKLES